MYPPMDVQRSKAWVHSKVAVRQPAIYFQCNNYHIGLQFIETPSCRPHRCNQATYTSSTPNNAVLVCGTHHK